MLPIASSSMTLFRFTFRLFVLICCILVVTSYKIDQHPSEDRHNRAVTEWRFRRNFFLTLPYFYPNYGLDDHSDTNEVIEHDNTDESYQKKYMPNPLYDRINT